MTARLRGPGFPRAGAFVLLGVLFSAALVIVVRELYGFDTFDGGDLLTGKAQNAILLVSLIAAPLFFLVGLGAFDYWFYWAAGRPTRPEDHSGHGAHTWRDYFKVNTDHKVIGIQYVVTSFFFMLVGGLLAMNGVAITTSSEVEKFAHTSSGMRQKDMPGARIVMIVTRKFSAVAIEDAPANCTPIVTNSWPIGTSVESGA